MQSQRVKASGVAGRASGSEKKLAGGTRLELIEHGFGARRAIFAGRLSRIDGDLEGFGSELIALLVREERI